MQVIIFLRGIIVGGHNIIKMDALKSCLSTAGFTNVITYIQSGNIICDTTIKTFDAIGNKIKEIIKAAFNLDVPAFVTNKESLESILSSCTLDFSTIDTKYLHYTLYNSVVIDIALQKIFMQKMLPEEQAQLSANALYLYNPNGYHTTKLTINFVEKTLGIMATARNHATITKIIYLAG